jgi:pimeloyl-ACP methyl ester carboxylesterase
LWGGCARRDLLAAAGKLPSFNRPTLIVWAAEDRVMPAGHAQRLADLLPDARIAMLPDTYTLIPLDQPQRLADLVREFVKTGKVAAWPTASPRSEREER